MSTNTAAISSFRTIKPVIRKEFPASAAEGKAPVISLAEKIDSYTNHTGLQSKPAAEPSWSMPPLVRAYFKGRDNDPL